MASIDFGAWLYDLNDGSVNADLGELLTKVVKAVEETGRAGSLTVKFTVSKEGRGGQAKVDVKPDLKLPQHAMPGTLFFVADNGALVREDPRQLKLRSVPEPQRARAIETGPAHLRDAKTRAAEGNKDDNDDGKEGA